MGRIDDEERRQGAQIILPIRGSLSERIVSQLHFSGNLALQNLEFVLAQEQGQTTLSLEHAIACLISNNQIQAFPIMSNETFGGAYLSLIGPDFCSHLDQAAGTKVLKARPTHSAETLPESMREGDWGWDTLVSAIFRETTAELSKLFDKSMIDLFTVNSTLELRSITGHSPQQNAKWAARVISLEAEDAELIVAASGGGSRGASSDKVLELLDVPHNAALRFPRVKAELGIIQWLEAASRNGLLTSDGERYRLPQLDPSRSVVGQIWSHLMKKTRQEIELRARSSNPFAGAEATSWVDNFAPRNLPWVEFSPKDLKDIFSISNADASHVRKKLADAELISYNTRGAALKWNPWVAWPKVIVGKSRNRKADWPEVIRIWREDTKMKSVPGKRGLLMTDASLQKAIQEAGSISTVDVTNRGLEVTNAGLVLLGRCHVCLNEMTECVAWVQQNSMGSDTGSWPVHSGCAKNFQDVIRVPKCSECTGDLWTKFVTIEDYSSDYKSKHEQLEHGLYFEHLIDFLDSVQIILKKKDATATPQGKELQSLFQTIMSLNLGNPREETAARILLDELHRAVTPRGKILQRTNHQLNQILENLDSWIGNTAARQAPQSAVKVPLVLVSGNLMHPTCSIKPKNTASMVLSL